MAATHVEPFATNPCFPDPPSSSALKEVCRAPYHETVNANDGSGGGATSGWAPQSVLRFALSSARSRLFEASTEAAIRGWLATGESDAAPSEVQHYCSVLHRCTDVGGMVLE